MNENTKSYQIGDRVTYQDKPWKISEIKNRNGDEEYIISRETVEGMYESLNLSLADLRALEKSPGIIFDK